MTGKILEIIYNTKLEKPLGIKNLKTFYPFEEVAKEHFGIDNIKPVAMNGIDECKVNLFKLKLGRSAENFFEGMACDGGCLNGALCIHHGPKNAKEVEKFGSQAKEKDVKNSVNIYNL